jgi:hypothetical protein
LARPLCLPCFPALPGQSMFLDVGAVDGLVVWPVVCLVVGLVVVVVLFVPVPVGLVVVVVLFVPMPVPVCAEVVAAEAPTRATPRTNAMSCFISLILRRSVPHVCQRNPALSVPLGARGWGHEPHRRWSQPRQSARMMDFRGNPENETASFQGLRPEILQSQVTKTA